MSRLFLSYCCLARSLRSEHYLRRGLPAIIVVAIADGMTVSDVADAAHLFVCNDGYEILNLARTRRIGSRLSLGDAELSVTLRKPRLLA